MKDYLLDENYDLLIKDGDFVVDECDDLDIELILLTEKGNWKESPMTGVGIRKWTNATMNSTLMQQLEREVRIQLNGDGFEVDKAQVITDNAGNFLDLQIEADRQDND